MSVKHLPVPDGSAASFAVKMSDGSMAPYFPAGSLAYIEKGGKLHDGDVGLFYFRGKVLLRQYCEDYAGNFYLFVLDRRLSAVPIRLRLFTPRVALFSEIVRGGSPSLARQGLACTATLLLNFMAGRYGDAAIAGMSIATRVSSFLFSFLLGFGQGFQPVCGFNYGARLYGRVLEGLWFCVKVGTAFLLVCAVAGLLWAPEVVRLFRHDPAVIAVGAAALRWQVLAFPLSAFVTVSNMMLQTIRKSTRAVILSSARQGLFFIPLIFLLPAWFGLAGVEAAQAVADVCSFFLAVPLVAGVLRELRRGDAPGGRG